MKCRHIIIQYNYVNMTNSNCVHYSLHFLKNPLKIILIEAKGIQKGYFCITNYNENHFFGIIKLFIMYHFFY